ncbi:MAG: ATP-binding protein [Nitrospinales bacterium]
MEKNKPIRVRLRTILLAVNLTILILPLCSIYFLKIYENELIRQTESELIAQGSFVAASYRLEVKQLLGVKGFENYGIQIGEIRNNEYYHPIPAYLDLANDEVRPPRPDPIEPTLLADSVGKEAGRNIIPIIKNATQITMTGIRVMDFQGVVVATSREELGMSYAHLPEVKLALMGGNSSLLRARLSDEDPPFASISRKTRIRVSVALPIIEEGQVIGAVLLSRSPRNMLKALYGKRFVVIAAMVILLLTALSLALIISFTVTRPIGALARQASEIAQGGRKKFSPIERPVTEEVASLAESFAHMAETVEHRSEYIRNFAAQVSHEFKTPLTSIQGSIELLHEHIEEMAPDQREKFLNNIKQDTDRLNRLVKRLLELARADVITPSEETADVINILNTLTERNKGYGLEVQFSKSDVEEAIVKMSPEAFETVISNLLDNSRQHGADQVAITMKKNKTVKDSFGSLEIILSDNGEGISSTNAEKIFAPFFTTNRDKGGTGLGLGIVKSLLEAHMGKIIYEPGVDGAVFKITLPTKILV